MYEIIGYNMLCEDFIIKFDSFVQAVKTYKEMINFNICYIHRTGDVKSCMFVNY